MTMKSLCLLALASLASALPSGHADPASVEAISNTNVNTDDSTTHHVSRRWGNGREAVTCSFWKWSNAEILSTGCRWVYNKSCWLNENGADSDADGYCNRKTCCSPYPPTEGPVKDIFRYTCSRYLTESGTECMGQLTADANFILSTHNCSWGTTEYVNAGLPICSEDFCCSWVVIPYYITGEGVNPDFSATPKEQPLPNSPHSVDESVKKAGSVAILEENYLLTQPSNWRSLQKPGTVPPPLIGGNRPKPPAPNSPQDTFGPSNAEATQLLPKNTTKLVEADGKSLDDSSNAVIAVDPHDVPVSDAVVVIGGKAEERDTSQ